MAYKLERTETFENDLDSILHYISFQLSAPKAAVALYKKIKITFDSVVKYPEMFQLYPSEWFEQNGYHFFNVGNYLVFYTIDQEQQIVYAQTVVYAAMDLTKLQK